MQILAVDDDPGSLFMTCSVIRRIDDADPVGFDNPVEALEWLDQNTPDLILLDQVMPDLDGMALLARIRARPELADVPVVMITADTSVKLRVDALEHGCTDFLTKPIIVPELVSRVQNLLRMHLGQQLMKEHASLLRTKVDEATALLRLQAQELVQRLSRAAEFRDPETGSHIERMARYSRLIAVRLGLSIEECDGITQAAPMHDIGKVGIPDAILLKPGRLTDGEMQVMRQHTVIGHTILKGSGHELINRAAEIALSHHEKFDGTGYPHGLIGEAIPLSCRIVAVADVFDALTTVRPYKRPWPLEEARAFLEGQAGLHFDPACVSAFLQCWDDAVAIHHAHPDEEELDRL